MKGEGAHNSLQRFIRAQAMFFVATAPSEGERVDVSPKGYHDTFAILDEHTGRVVRPDDPEFLALRPHFGLDHPGIRAAEAAHAPALRRWR
nr:hypothetical protein [Nocardia terpenica]